MKPMLALLAATTMFSIAAAPSLAGPKNQTRKVVAKPAAHHEASCCVPGAVKKEGCRCGAKTDAQVPASGVRKLPFDVASALRNDAASRSPMASATLYANRSGALTGLTISTRGLPDPERLAGRESHYVVWLMDTESQTFRKLGALESHNSGDAVFGFSSDTPIIGYDRLMVTTEASAAARAPGGMQHLSADLPKACQAGCCKDH